MLTVSEVGSSAALAVVLVALLAGGAAGQAGPAVPDPDRIAILIQKTVIALDHANRTGNYTVLRDLGSPGFRRANTAARLAQIFGKLRRRKLDFGPIVLFPARLTRPAEIDSRGMLRLTGFFPTQPEKVSFDLSYRLIQGRWRVFAISINTSLALPFLSEP